MAPGKRKNAGVEAPSTKKRATKGKAAVPATQTVPAPQATVAPRKLPSVVSIEIPEGTKNFLLAAPVSLGFFRAPVSSVQTDSDALNRTAMNGKVEPKCSGTRCFSFSVTLAWTLATLYSIL
jgi:hypothetical protein